MRVELDGLETNKSVIHSLSVFCLSAHHLKSFWGAVVRWVDDSSTVDEAMQRLIAAFELL